MSEGISFAGDGSKDVSINQTTTGNADYGRSDQKEIEFAGNGGSDVNHSFMTKHGSQSVGSKGEIKFAGDN